MSNYISNENQRLLWKSLNQIPTFAKLQPPKKEFEFKKVVEHMYHKYATPNRPIFTITELQEINRETLSVFLPESLYPASAPATTRSRQENAIRAFQERQNIYENMNKKPVLPSPEEIFREKIEEEEKIQNMDELISNYQKQREIDIIAPPPPLLQQLQPPPQNKKLKLLEETILPDNEVDDLENSRLSKKSVSWKPDLLQPPEWQSKIESLEMKIKELENKNETLEKRLDELECHWRENKNTAKYPSLQKENNRINVVVDSTLNDIVHKIEKMDRIKNKMKMFSSI